MLVYVINQYKSLIIYQFLAKWDVYYNCIKIWGLIVIYLLVLTNKTILTDCLVTNKTILTDYLVTNKTILTDYLAGNSHAPFEQNLGISPSVPPYVDQSICLKSFKSSLNLSLLIPS